MLPVRTCSRPLTTVWTVMGLEADCWPRSALVGSVSSPTYSVVRTSTSWRACTADLPWRNMYCGAKQGTTKENETHLFTRRNWSKTWIRHSEGNQRARMQSMAGSLSYGSTNWVKLQKKNKKKRELWTPVNYRLNFPLLIKCLSKF